MQEPQRHGLPVSGVLLGRVVVVPVDDLETIVDAVVHKRIRECFARVEPLLPPYSQHALPVYTRKKEFLAAVQSGCPHRRKGPLFLVERADWSAWIMRRQEEPAIAIRATVHPTPANDAPPEPSPTGPRDVVGVLAVLKKKGKHR